MNHSTFKEELEKLNINITDNQIQKLEMYLDLLVEYNKVMNLTGIVEHDEVFLKHFYDSLTLARDIDLTKDISVCDIGTGAGFPGMVLKIVFPNLKMTLVDSLNKRIEFLKIVIDKLELKGIEAIHARVEDYALNNREKFDLVTARAVASLPMLLEYSIPLVKVDGYFIPMKGSKREEEESKNALKVLDSTLVKIDNFLLPIEESGRNLYIIKKDKVTNKKYPRKFSEMKKKSL